jgi:tricorn protease
LKKQTFILLGIFLLSVFSGSAEETRLLRMPDINGNLIVFVYAGDIWSVPASGGDAKRLTSDIGLEIYPKISPDGDWIAFSGEYSGSRQIFVMPSAGGTPKQLTYYNDVGMMPPRGGFDHYPLDWTPDSRSILFRANRTPFGQRMGKYFLIGREGGLEKPLPIPEAGGGTFSPDGNKIVYTPISREFRTWKRYKGGRAQDVWIYDLTNDTSQRLTAYEGTDQHPFWFGDTIYYVSDRELTLNIYSRRLDSGEITRVTRHDEYDVLWPSGENGMVVYQNGGYIYKLNLEDGQTEKVQVNIQFDNPNTLPYFKNVKENIVSFDVSPTGKRGLFEARGDIFTVPAEHGVIYNLTRTQGTREMNPKWSPDGRYIVYSSDQTGEYEFYLLDRAQDNRITQLTKNSRTWEFPPVWSPDSSKLLFSTKDLGLQLYDIETKEAVVIDKARTSDITTYRWSPDSRWVVYSRDGRSGQQAVYVYSLENRMATQLTDDIYQDDKPEFSSCGRYLFFLSNRDFNLSFSSFEFDYVFNDATRIYALALTADTPPLIPEENDIEVLPAAKKSEPAEKTSEEDQLVTIDFEGIHDRIISLPPKAGNYQAIWSVEGGLLYLSGGALHLFKFDGEKDDLIIKGISGGRLTAAKTKFMYRAGSNYGIIDLKPNQKPGDGFLDFSGMTLKIYPLKEWEQIFNDGWTIYREWFYVENMHGVDWNAMKEKYGRLLPYVSHRADLDFLFGELVGELNVGHAYVNWGDFPRVERVEGGLLGAEFETDENSNRYRISRIFPGENWNDRTRSPLREQGVMVKEGDYLIRINGYDVTAADNPYRFLENTAGEKITIQVSSTPDEEDIREYWIKPVNSELNLRYLAWVQSRRRMVEKLSGGRIGYFHVPDTSMPGNRELFKGFYAFEDKDALIIDERYNGGGFIPDVMIRLLDRRILNYWARRGLQLTSTPAMAHAGPKAMLINHYSSSGGDAFPFYFREKKLGTLIGTRTWGGLVGMSGNPSLIDGGNLAVPTFGFVNKQGEWDVEGLGVPPDIEVYDRPEEIVKGHDPSLEKAVEILMKELTQNPPEKIKKPEAPDRSNWHEKKKKK